MEDDIQQRQVEPPVEMPPVEGPVRAAVTEAGRRHGRERAYHRLRIEERQPPGGRRAAHGGVQHRDVLRVMECFLPG